MTDEPPAEAALLARVDPELRAAALRMRQSMAAFSPMTLARLAERRAWIGSLSPEPHPDMPVTVDRTTAPDGAELGLVCVNARPGARRPGILHLHGGGFTASSAMGGIRAVQETARALDAAVVSVDYRLAPEAPHAVSAEDGYAGLRWLHAHADALGIDPARVAILGESAGGGHAALLAAKARDRGELPVAFQALIYPMLDDRTGSSRPVPPHLGAFGWNVEANRFGWECFLGAPPGGTAVDPAAVPARNADLAGLPAAFIGVGALDLFVEESIEHARRLILAGVPTELVVAPGGFHGFDTICPEAAVSRRFAAARLDALRRGLAAAA